MTHEEREAVADEVFTRVKELLRGKGGDYGSVTDANANFKDYENMGLTRFQTWFLYVSKHWAAIRNAVARNPDHPKRYAESIKESIIDVITYNIILLTMLYEKEQEQNNPQ